MSHDNLHWRNVSDRGWVLWSSFQFDMVDAHLTESKYFPGKRYAYAKLDDGPPEIGFTVVEFTMTAGKLAQQERSILREPSGDTQPSPRGDGSSHYYQWQNDFLILMKGPDVERKVITFTNSFDDYVKKFCSLSS